MDFGSIQCTPKNPLCESCPFSSNCIAFNQNKIGILPIKKGKQKVIDRYFNYLVIQDQNGEIQLEKRTEKGIWQNLFQFPLVETNYLVNNKKQLFEKISSEKMDELNPEKLNLWNSNPIIHKLSHQKLHIFFWTITSKTYLRKGYSLKALKKRAFPVVIQNFIDNFFKVEA